MKNNGGGVLPSFHDILWCPDVDGDVMDTSGMGGAMVSRARVAIWPFLKMFVRFFNIDETIPFRNLVLENL